MERNWQKTLGVSVAVLGVAAIVAVLVVVLTGDDDGGGGGPKDAAERGGSTERPAGAPSVPSGPARMGPAPSAIPAVREWKPVRGQGWKPDRYSRVVADPDGPLADEARLLARELRVKASGGPARPGDVELRRTPGAKTGREGYVLTSRKGRVEITGSHDAGVFYGTRTLLQTVRDQGRFAEGTVRDRPDRPQRGFMLDIARKPFSAEWIERRIREMGDLKLNQFQLHLSDDQAFRVESDRYPEIVSDPHLTKAEVRRIVKLAASRHIEVIPEIDSPGHLGAVIKAHPELQLRSASGSPAPGAVDITRPKAAKILDDLTREYAELFPGRWWHLGGDEYQALMTQNPEASYPRLAAAARKRYGARGRVQDLATDWLNDRAKTVREVGKTPQVWNDGMHRGGAATPHRDREVTYWTGKEIGAREPEEYLREGWKVVNLNDEYLYYVLGEPNQFTYPTGERVYREWTPAVLRGSEPVPDKWAGPDRILGGRFAVWGDLADAQSTEQVARGIRMPLRATAQKLWDPRKPTRSWESFTRLAGRVD
ncbi:beta-N-acetylglucosaminidase [Streptomyces sp. AJS327]|uniref:family 20 glycosylhydrolase n=1 Tax=Streptomyces sp. AJS327 TaxID=2545265 RepID=UPI0015DD5353|nr:family 20 glycosylhydrolase [Streptomyces sp. AJS327]MBA0054174.1 beta-N-acetylglucosaminidase [Streptomyces sp. AJS327]